MLENGYLDVTQYAILSGLSYQTVLNYADAGILPYKLINRHCFFELKTLVNGILLSNKQRTHHLDVYFIGSGLEEQEVSEPFAFEHSGCITCEELIDIINNIVEESMLIGCNIPDRKCIEAYLPAINSKRDESVEKYKLSVMEKEGITKEEFKANVLYKPRILSINDFYKVTDKEIGKKAREIIDKGLIVEIAKDIRKKISKATQNGVYTSVTYDTTEESFSISNFTEQLVRILKGNVYTDVNLHISGTVPSYISDMCNKLSEVGVLTNYEIG